MSKRLVFVGAGAVGSFVGGLISAAGEEVILIDPWPDHVNAIKEGGLRVSGTQGEHHSRPRALHINEVQSLIKSPVDIAFICTKSYDTAWGFAFNSGLSIGGRVCGVDPERDKRGHDSGSAGAGEGPGMHREQHRRGASGAGPRDPDSGGGWSGSHCVPGRGRWTVR